MLIFHHNDLDGRCAAAILGDPGDEYIEMDYKDAIPWDRVKGDVGIVDFSFKPITMERIRDQADLVIWCDHHATAKDYPYQDLLGVRDFTTKGMSGCECVWEYCHPGTQPPYAVELIGDYDTWRLQLAPACFEFYEGLKLEDNQPADKIWSELFDPTVGQATVRAVRANGETAIRYRDVYCKNMAKGYGYETVIDGVMAFALNVYRFGPKGFGDLAKQYPVCIAYIHDGNKFTVSLYSETVDVSKIAKNHGGGGHKGAAGFVTANLPFTRGE